MRSVLPFLALALGLVAGEAAARPHPTFAPPAPAAPAAPAVAPVPPAAVPATPPTPPVQWWSGSFSFGRGRLGVQVSSMTPELRVFFGAQEDAGMLVQRVEEKTPAELAGVTVGDVVVEIDGDRIADVADVAEALSDRSKGDKVTVVVVRGKKRKSLVAVMEDESSPMGAGPLRLSLPPFDRDLERKLDEALERLEALEKRLDGGAKPRRKGSEAPKSRRKPTRDET